MARLVDAFNTLPDGGELPAAARYDVKKIANWIGERHLGRVDTADAAKKHHDAGRRRDAIVRVDLYEDRGAPHFEQMIKDVFQDPDVRADRLRVLPYARFQNVTRRIAWEQSMVYKAPAKRQVKNSNEGYQAFAKAASLDVELREAQRYITFLNEVFLAVRTRTVEGKKVPVVDVVTPNAFTAIAHPLDKKELVAIVLDRQPVAIVEKPDDPWYVIWAEDVRIFLRKDGTYISHIDNPYGVIPGVLAHRRKPRECLLDQHSGQDIVDAHYAVCLLNVMMLFGQKTGTKAPYTTGDMSRTTRGQALDQDKITQFQEGVAPGVLDLGHDPASLIASAKSTIAQVAANYGIPEDVFNMTHSPTSGYDRRLKRWGLEERRDEQVPLWREYERELAAKASIVMARDAEPEYRFDVEGWQIDFGEVAAPQEPMTLLAWRKEARSLALRTAVDDIREDNPDLDEDQAEAVFVENVAQRAREVELMRALNAPRDPTQAGQSPAENGARGQDDDEEEDDENPADPMAEEAAA